MRGCLQNKSASIFDAVTRFNVKLFIVFGIIQPAQADLATARPAEQIQVLPVARTPESDSVLLTIAVPKAGDQIAANPMWVQFRIDGFALGAGSSQFDRSKELPVSDMGQTVHVVIDNEPYFAINEPAISPFNEEGYFYNTSYKFELPVELKEGVHTIRMFPARSYGESLKGENTLHAIHFSLGSAGSMKPVDLSKPYLTYNEPSETTPLRLGQPILLDFLVTNCELTSDGYKVRLTIDGKINRMLTTWQPYYLYGLSRGKHSIRIELLNPQGNVVGGPFNDVERTIMVR
ncbi:MAG: hypothetical protein HY861_01540 [Chlamydiia bacterium]|nr:hypothetical protein [Chlamydiia bacterium]